MFDFHLRLNITKGKVKELNLKKEFWTRLSVDGVKKKKN